MRRPKILKGRAAKLDTWRPIRVLFTCISTELVLSVRYGHGLPTVLRNYRDDMGSILVHSACRHARIANKARDAQD